MTDPEEFATFCHPEKHHWQLLDNPFSRKEFLNLPNLRPKFFEMGMIIVAPKTAVNKALKGKVMRMKTLESFYPEIVTEVIPICLPWLSTENSVVNITNKGN